MSECSFTAHLPGGVTMLYASKGAWLVTRVIWNTHKHTCTPYQQLAAGSEVVEGTRCQSWLQSNSRRLNPKAHVSSGSPSSPSQGCSFTPDRRVFLQETSGSEQLEPLLRLTRVQELMTPLGSPLTAVLVTTGTERLSCHGFVSSGSSIASHLSQDYSSDLLFPLKQTGENRPKCCAEIYFIINVSKLLTLLAEMGINLATMNSFILKIVIWWLWCYSA